MICDSCKIDRSVNDFINNQKFCFHCEYRRKLSKAPKKRTPKPIFCRVCRKEVVRIENLKKRQRTVFCSCECAQIGHKELSNNHWTRRIRSEGIKYGFNLAH